MDIQLRDYQSQAADQLRANIRAGILAQILCMGTGSGKTVVAAYLAEACHAKGKRLVFVVDRVALIDQTSALFDSYGIPHGIIQAQHWRFRPWERVQIASVQTADKRGLPDDADMFIIDEAHGLRKIVADLIATRRAPVIGLTATPFTKGLGKHYQSVVNVISTNRLIADGHLVSFRIFAASEPDMTGAKVIAGEWSDSDAESRAMPIVGDCVAEYLKHGADRKFIAFGATVAHCEELQRQFMAAGVVCEVYSYRTGEEARVDMVTEFRKPDSCIRGLVSVAALSKGFDVPDVGVIIMARPLKSSLAEHIQILGRGLRPFPGKDHCLVLDHSGNCVRFWDQMQDFFEHGAIELDDGTRKEKKPAAPKEKQAVKCSQCSCVHKAAPCCPSCGFEYPRKASSVVHKPGTLKELIAGGNRVATKNIWPQIVWLAHERGKTDKWAFAQYRSMTGEWPAADFDSTAPVEASQAVRNKIQQLQIVWARGCAKGAERRTA